ncbi:DNA repair helicase rad25 [Pseudoloma neurophilia]|uniref:DNA 3'-5' helicase n=1 Tax=Pseudoloma neurophilia TaxID=146866 RepID=A0A0R0M4V2_9MICR|nr:DNA repair helicase rad25 [Pseudoloma neurophilia]
MTEAFLPKQASRKLVSNEEIKLKENHETYPFWVNCDGLIILETFSPHFKAATDFLIAISEPISRPKYIHEYKITSYSLYAAASVGLTTDDILISLDKLSKNYIPNSIKEFVVACTLSYGKLKLVLRDSKHYIEAQSEEIFKRILKDSVISKALINQENTLYENKLQNVALLPDDTESLTTLTIDFGQNAVFSREVHSECLEGLKKRCIDIDFPLIEEYDFRKDHKLKNIDIELKNNIVIRTYQEISLNKMFGNGRGRSGIIVLPCGSGKTLVGITAICTIKKPTIILCTSAVSVEQWKAQIHLFSMIQDKDVACFTSDKKESSDNILISTYTMLCFSGKRSNDAQRVMDLIRNTEWGLLILDEVHVVPAQMFRKVISTINHHCKLGLTATLLREDDKIEDLNFLIGTKLYEADWQYLSLQGHIASVSCFEIWCKMTSNFYAEYLKQNSRKRKILSIMNPIKFQITQYLINYHERRGDKIIVFSDNVHALKSYALKLGKPYIYGPTSQQERMRILKQFQTNPLINTLFLSKVGDTSIDLPEATCLIQISSHFGSRRQEAQRLGRILRAKRRNDPGFKVFFYSLVSKDTDEMYYSSKRQQYLIDQGYTFKVYDNMNIESFENRVFKTKEEQNELLASILLASEKDLESEDCEETTMSQKNIKNVSNVENMAYIESKRRITGRENKRKK